MIIKQIISTLCFFSFLQAMERPTIRSVTKNNIEQGNPINVNMGWGRLGTTPLIDAAAAGDVEAATLFLAHGADINGTNSAGKTALATAIFTGKHKIARLLLKRGALRYIADKKGNMATFWLTHNVATGHNYAWPKDLLVKLQGVCFICLEDIDVIGHAYACGHVVHEEHVIPQCPLCQK